MCENRKIDRWISDKHIHTGKEPAGYQRCRPPPCPRSSARGHHPSYPHPRGPASSLRSSGTYSSPPPSPPPPHPRHP